jgi:hypothetical protein
LEYGAKCRVHGCTNLKTAQTQACSQHKEQWQKHSQKHNRVTYGGIRRVIQHQNENMPWTTPTNQDEQPHDEPAPEMQRKTYFVAPRFYCVETICAPCGVVIAWAKFAKSESPSNILAFLEKVYPTEESRPAYVCIDKACLVLCTSLTNGSWDSIWKKTTRFIVDSYHYINHRTTDFLCRKWCNPAPLNGSAPNLVVAEEDKQGRLHYKRAFNTQACEQLNAWLGGYETILKRMTPGNFNWFLHTMLFYHTKHVIDKQRRKESTSVVEDTDSESEIEM